MAPRRQPKHAVHSARFSISDLSPLLTSVDRLRREGVERDLTFEYCLMSAGTSFNRAPSGQRLETGDIFSLDGGGNYKGYIGDLCRMGFSVSQMPS